MQQDNVPLVPRPCEGVDLASIARCEGTPLYVYSAGAIRRRQRALLDALAGMDADVCYAVKANSNVAILQLMAQAGIGADIVSGGELWRALKAGMAPSRIVFSGVGKSQDEIVEALEAGIARFNVESHDELLLIEQVAGDLGVVAHAAVRINPDVVAGGHAKISTGKSENKFGVSIDEARGWFVAAHSRKHVLLDGLHVHIGSQILDLAPIRQALRCVADFWRELEQGGHAIASIDVGGGLGVRYRDGDFPLAAEEYVGEIRSALAGFKGRIVLEPGRYLVAEAGVLLTRVVRVKPGVQRSFLVVDAAMNDLLRPSLYDAWHDIVRMGEPTPMAEYDIVGPVCETGDTFALARRIGECQAGDLVAIHGAGAYGATMASTYNSRPLVAEVLVDDDRYAVIRRRQTRQEMVMGEQTLPEWQAA